VIRPLSFAVCDDRTLRNELVQRLCDEFPGLVVVALSPQTSDVYRDVSDRVGDSRPAGVFVLDLEASVPFQADSYPTLRSLNGSRELWERLAFPVVFWLAEYAAALISSKAPDFWRYRSHQFEFVSERATVSRGLTELFPGFEIVDALPFEEKRFRIAELEQRLDEVGPEPSPDLLQHALNWVYELAHLYSHASKYGRAQALQERAVQWAESAYGSADSRTATALSNLAHSLQATNRLADAEPLMRRALAIEEQSLGSEHPMVATGLNNLASLLQATNRLTEAEPLMRRALAIDEQSFGPEHPNVAIRLNNLASLLQDTNRLAEAEPLMRRVVGIVEKSLGENHPNVATALSNLASLLQATNRLAEAEPLLRRALAIDEQSFGPEHPNVAIRLNNLASLLQDTNRLAEAEPLMRRGVTIFEKSLGENHPNVAAALNNLASLLQTTNRLAEAEPLMRRALAILFDFKRNTGIRIKQWPSGTTRACCKRWARLRRKSRQPSNRCGRRNESQAADPMSDCHVLLPRPRQPPALRSPTPTEKINPSGLVAQASRPARPGRHGGLPHCLLGTYLQSPVYI
jgi:tetratricopeptide (TPR) repeat protein